MHTLYITYIIYICMYIYDTHIKVLSSTFKLLEKRMTPLYRPAPKYKGSFEVSAK